VRREARRIEAVRGWWADGSLYSIPVCCRVRWIADRLWPSPLRRLAPNLHGRLLKLRPRYAVADGIVPCEAHLARYLLTGRPTVPDPRRNPTGLCCEIRAIMADHGVVLERVTVETTDEAGRSTGWAQPWMLQVEGETACNVSVCPWCGVVLERG
jgi:hypothetical protein